MATCRCGKMDMANAPHVLHGCDAAVVTYQVMGAPQYGREAHTERECYREVLCDESWTLAHKAWVASLSDVHPEMCPMPVGHIMFAVIPGSPALARKDNAIRARVAS